ncbi:MAG: DUF262 domain-containing protein, partial [Desulfatibacillaceae bacterium]|nr:DUF262 domain-containing protein [Desulfatibacillaceae bacterium]
MSGRETIKQFLNRNSFRIPNYQRGFAWDASNIYEFYEDVRETTSTTSHYLGTIVLSKTNDNETYYIVDGQQRITTILLFMSAIISKLNNRDDKLYYKRVYINHKNLFKLYLHDSDQALFEKILLGKTISFSVVSV